MVIGFFYSLTHDTIYPARRGKKKPLLGRLILCALFHIPAAVLRNQDRRFPFPQRRISGTKGAAMLIRLAFHQNNFLKKSLCPAGGSSGHEYELYHVRKLHIAFIFAQWVYDLPGEFCRFLRSFSAGRNFRSNIDTVGGATGPGFSLSRRSGVRK